MTVSRRILALGFLAAAYVGISAAGSITYTATSFTAATDYNPPAIFTLPDFNLVGQVLTGVTISFTGGLTTSQMLLQNTAGTTLSGGVQTFIYQASSTLSAVAGSDSADAGLSLAALSDAFIIKNTGTVTLGGGANTTVVNCSPITAPSASCNSVDFAGGGSLIDGPSTTSVSDSNLSDYVGAGHFTIDATTLSFESFSGGGGNVNVTQATTGTTDFSVMYTYQPAPSTPEPGTLFLMGTALVGCGLLRKRIKS